MRFVRRHRGSRGVRGHRPATGVRLYFAQGTARDADATNVALSNRGLDVYSAFGAVAVLSTARRLHKHEGPEAPLEFARNGRSDTYLEILHRLRAPVWSLRGLLLARANASTAP